MDLELLYWRDHCMQSEATMAGAIWAQWNGKCLISVFRLQNLHPQSQCPSTTEFEIFLLILKLEFQMGSIGTNMELCRIDVGHAINGWRCYFKQPFVRGWWSRRQQLSSFGTNSLNTIAMVHIQQIQKIVFRTFTFNLFFDHFPRLSATTRTQISGHCALQWIADAVGWVSPWSMVSYTHSADTTVPLAIQPAVREPTQSNDMIRQLIPGLWWVPSEEEKISQISTRNDQIIFDNRLHRWV